jgi:hypothetical protein
MSGQWPSHKQLGVSLPDFGPGDDVVLCPSCGDNGLGTTATTSTTTTMRWHQPGALCGGGLK